MMLACYPGRRAAYPRHIDNIDGDGREAKDHGRCFSLVYYLNEDDWSDADGAALRLYSAPPFDASMSEAASSSSYEP